MLANPAGLLLPCIPFASKLAPTGECIPFASKPGRVSTARFDLFPRKNVGHAHLTWLVWSERSGTMYVITQKYLTYRLESSSKRNSRSQNSNRNSRMNSSNGGGESQQQGEKQA